MKNEFHIVRIISRSDLNLRANFIEYVIQELRQISCPEY